MHYERIIIFKYMTLNMFFNELIVDQELRDKQKKVYEESSLKKKESNFIFLYLQDCDPQLKLCTNIFLF